jgi:hypothetical protein
MLTNHLRNPIYVFGTELTSLDTFTLEVKITYEIIPTPDYKSWVSTDRSRASINDTRELSDLTGNIPDI